MRDKRFVAEHRGGPLKKEQHKQLIGWACTCTEHLFSILPCEPDKRLVDALSVAYRWECGNAAVGEARKAALKCIEAARESDDPVIIAVSRAAGHAVATAHMADHSLGPALYGLKAVKLAGRSVEDERNWQNNQLPAEIRELVISARTVKEKSFRI
jgi:hypothetical protein